MDYKHIVHLATAARCGSLTAAAGVLGISQPALSKSIRAFESSLGVRLLERGRFGVRATVYGDAVIARGSVIDAEIRGVSEEIAALRRTGNVRVSIGCGPSEATRLLPETLAVLSRRHPELRVTVLYGLNETLMPMVKKGEIEFALSSVPRGLSQLPAAGADPLGGARRTADRARRQRAAVGAPGRHHLATPRHAH